MISFPEGSFPKFCHDRLYPQQTFAGPPLLVLLVLPSCLMLLLTVAVLWPCLANFRTTVKTLRDVRLPAILKPSAPGPT